MVEVVAYVVSKIFAVEEMLMSLGDDVIVGDGTSSDDIAIPDRLKLQTVGKTTEWDKHVATHQQ